MLKLQNFKTKLIPLLSVSILTTALYSSTCYTAVAGFTGVAETEALIASSTANLVLEIERMNQETLLMLEKEERIKTLSVQIMLIRKNNNEKLKEIEFYKGKR